MTPFSDSELDHDADERALQGVRVLAADDEQLVLMVVSRMLARVGAEVVTAGSADEAEGLYLSRSAPFDVLLTDVVMPGRDGVALAHALRAHQPDLPVLFMSGWSSYTAADHGLPGPLLAKPFTVATLRDALVRAIAANRPGSTA